MLGWVLGDEGGRGRGLLMQNKEEGFNISSFQLELLFTYVFGGNIPGPLLFPRRHSRFRTERAFGDHPRPPTEDQEGCLRPVRHWPAELGPGAVLHIPVHAPGLLPLGRVRSLGRRLLKRRLRHGGGGGVSAGVPALPSEA